VTNQVAEVTKKILLANPCGHVADAVFNAANPCALDAWVGVLAYAFQIYFDFCGYSDMAVGLGRMLGFEFMKNFDAPYRSESITEVWRRWHLSLSTFLRDYLYIPLGGNRLGSSRTYFNVAVVMLLGGLWHGAAWSYLIWGGFHGIALAFERFILKRVHIPSHPLINLLRVVSVFIFVTFAWLLFALPEFSHVILFIKSVINNTRSVMDMHTISTIIIYSFPVIIYHFHYYLQTRIEFDWQWVRPISYGTMLFLLITNSGSAGKFIYFQF